MLQASQADRDACLEWELPRGECIPCRQPQWCDDDKLPAGARIGSPDAWIERYAHNNAQQRQCVFKPSQKEAFIETTRRYLLMLRDHPEMMDAGAYIPALENEVSFYVGEGDGGLAEAMVKSLVALITIRGHNGYHADRAIELGRHLRKLGKAVPWFQITLVQHM